MFEGVKTRFAWLLPILKPDYVVRRVMEAIAGNRSRLIMPRFVMTVPVIRVLPPFLFDAVLSFFGVNSEGLRIAQLPAAMADTSGPSVR